MNVAFDLGSSEFRSLRQDGGRLLARRIPAHYCVLPAADPQRRYLEQGRIPHQLAEEQIIVMGEHAEQVSLVQNTPLVPVITRSGIPQDDPVGRQVCASLLASLVPQRNPHFGRRVPCVATLPADSSSDSMTGVFFGRLLRLLGYDVTPVYSGFALVLSSLAEQGYTGLAISFGSEAISCCLSLTGVPEWEDTFVGGARIAEEVLAETRQQYLFDRNGHRYLDMQAVSRWVRSPAVSLIHPEGTDAQLLATLYREWLDEAVEQVAIGLEKANLKHFRRPMHIALGGGPTNIHGFVPLFIDLCRKQRVPISEDRIIVVPEDPFQMARGALILALLDDERPMWSAAAA